MAHRVPFYLYRRHKTKGDYWYVSYLDPETGSQTTAKSIDCLKERLGIFDFRPVARKVEAAIIAQKALEEGIIFNDLSKKLFADYCLEFWDYEKSEYIKLRNSQKENSIGKEYAYNMQKSFLKNVVPLLPAQLKLVNVTTKILDGVIKKLYLQGLSGGTIQILEYSLSVPLGEAVRLGVLRRNPMDGVLRGPRNEHPRGVLTRKEVIALMEALEEKKAEMFPSYYYGIILALATGMRCSEIRALHREDFEPVPDMELEKLKIRRSVAYLTGLKETKGKYERAVFIPKDLAWELKKNASPIGIVLPSKHSGKKYMSSPSLRNAFYEVLETIGIGESERKERNLTFHSLRHTFSTLSRDSSISQEDRMLVLGHKSEEVNARYTHSTDEALYRVSFFTKEILNVGGNKVS